MSRSRDAADQINRVNSSAADATVITIDSSENVGIGTTPSGNLTAGYNLRLNGGSQTFLAFNNTTHTTQVLGGFAIGNDASAVYITQRENQPIVIATNDTERMRLTSGGDLGLGTSSPRSDANIATLEVSGSTFARQILQATGTGGREYALLSGTSGSFSIYDYTAGATRTTIDTSGNFHVGKTVVSNAAGCTLYDHGQAYFVTGAGEATLLVNNSGGSNSTNTLIQFYRNSSGVGTVTTTGSSTAYNTSSDYRLKTDVQPMTGASARVQALNPVNFEWIADGTRVDGFLAHEAQAVVPEAVTGAKDAMRDEEYEVTPAVEATYDDEGNELTAAVDAVMGTRSVIDPQAIDQSKLVPLLTAALQEALTKIDSLESRLTALEG